MTGDQADALARDDLACERLSPLGTWRQPVCERSIVVSFGAVVDALSSEVGLCRRRPPRLSLRLLHPGARGGVPLLRLWPPSRTATGDAWRTDALRRGRAGFAGDPVDAALSSKSAS